MNKYGEFEVTTNLGEKFTTEQKFKYWAETDEGFASRELREMLDNEPTGMQMFKTQNGIIAIKNSSINSIRFVGILNREDEKAF